MVPRALLDLECFRRGQPRLQDADLVLRFGARPGVSFHWVAEPLVIYNDLNYEERVSRTVSWEYWLAWLQDNRHVLTRKAYAGALLNIVTAYAARLNRKWEAAFPILDEAFAKGSPAINDLCAYVTRWLLPRQMHLLLKRWMKRQVSSKQTRACPAEVTNRFASTTRSIVPLAELLKLR